MGGIWRVGRVNYVMRIRGWAGGRGGGEGGVPGGALAMWCFRGAAIIADVRDGLNLRRGKRLQQNRHIIFRYGVIGHRGSALFNPIWRDQIDSFEP